MGNNSDYCDEHGGPHLPVNAQIRCPFCRELILAGAQKCRFCGEFLKRPRAIAPVEVTAVSGGTAVALNQSRTEGFAGRVGNWVGRHPVWTCLLLILFFGYVGRSAIESERGVGQQSSATIPRQSAENSAEPQKQAAATQPGVRDSSFTPKQREDLAGLLNKSFQDQDVEISVFTGGSDNSELFLSSELLKESSGRTNILTLIRAQWQDQLCKAGFTTIILSDSSVLGLPREYPLRCSWTPNDRAELAGSMRDDPLKGEMGGTVQASGVENRTLSIITNSEAFDSPSARTSFFQQMEQRQMVAALCLRGFRKLSIEYSPTPKALSQFDLKCRSGE